MSSLKADAPRAATSVPAPTRSILVIDDSALIREAAKIALATIAGWRIVTATGGEQGIELAGSEHFDAILIDVVMDGMDGIAVAERLRGLDATSSVPLLLLTAERGLADSDGLRRAGIAGVIAKPFEISALSLEVCRLLGW
jgi:CheY-like chemotaxis protein